METIVLRRIFDCLMEDISAEQNSKEDIFGNNSSEEDKSEEDNQWF